MFNKLRNRIIIINMATSSVILFLAFSFIYISAANRMPDPDNIDFPYQGTVLEDYFDVHDQINELVSQRISSDHQQGLSSLLVNLILAGIAIELAVFLVSYYLAIESIKPIRETYEAQKQFIANASHEIKTPLAAIQANLEAADIHDNHWIDNIQVKTEELASLNNQLLTLARVESADAPTETTEIELPQYIKDFLAPLQPQIEQKQLHLRITKNSLTKPTVKLNEPAFHQILGILIDNAIKYSATKITVTISDGLIKVANDGANIEPEKLSHIFERFYQTDKTKSGVGLGLAIAKQVADQNRWTLTCESHKLTTFTLKFAK